MKKFCYYGFIALLITIFLGSVVCIGLKLVPRILVEIEIGNPYDHPNYAGTLSISSLGIEVPCVRCDNMDEDQRRKVVDKVNCAALYSICANPVFTNDDTKESHSVTVIAEHSYQEFLTLKDCEVGMTATIEYSDGSVDEYVVVKVFEGINSGATLEYNSGGSVFPDNLGGLVLYTCMDETAIPVYIVFLQPQN